MPSRDLREPSEITNQDELDNYFDDLTQLYQRYLSCDGSGLVATAWGCEGRTGVAVGCAAGWTLTSLYSGDTGDTARPLHHAVTPLD
jgi:hypothetical protein